MKIINEGTDQLLQMGGKVITLHENVIVTIAYGLLYNWYVASDIRNVANIGWHVPHYPILVNVNGDFNTLGTYIGGDTFSEKLVETGTTYWFENYGTNTTKFNARGAGDRNIDGSFSGFQLGMNMWTDRNDTYGAGKGVIANIGSVVFNYPTNGYNSYNKIKGETIRLIKDTTSLTNGQEGTYTGNDGKLYRTICIGTQEWLADNLIETKYRDGSSIPEVTGNAAWAALTTGALCAYNNDWNNV